MRTTLARRFLAVAAAALTGFIAAGTAAASPPERSTFQIDDTFLSGTSEDCGFDILLHLEGSIVVTDFLDEHGELVRSLVTYPGLFYTFINAETGRSVTSRSPDPEHYTMDADGSLTIMVTGLVMRVSVPGSGEQAVQAGRFVIDIGPDGEATEGEPIGRSDDYHDALCEVLAP
jgi:hypothetical protein